MPSFPTLVIDFDSTFVRCESLDMLAGMALAEHPERHDRLQRIQHITNQGMAGELSFTESLSQRLALFQAHVSQVEHVATMLQQYITPSFARHASFLHAHRDHIYVVTGGFNDYVRPVVATFGIDPERVIGNKFRYDDQGYVIGCDTRCIMAQANGKVHAVKNLMLPHPIVVIGDGMTDYEICGSGAAQHFIAFTENVQRQPVMEKADSVASSFDDVLAFIQQNALH